VKSFIDRSDAGDRLGIRLSGMLSEGDVVIGLARGGMPVAFEVARLLKRRTESGKKSLHQL